MFLPGVLANGCHNLVLGRPTGPPVAVDPNVTAGAFARTAPPDGCGISPQSRPAGPEPPDELRHRHDDGDGPLDLSFQCHQGGKCQVKPFDGRACSRTLRLVDNSSDSVSWISAWLNWYRSLASGNSSITCAARASSTNSSNDTSIISSLRALSSLKSNSRPTTDAVARTRLHPFDRRLRRHSPASQSPSGMLVR